MSDLGNKAIMAENIKYSIYFRLNFQNSIEFN